MDSVISRSQSISSTSTINKDLVEGTYGPFDALFPIYEQMSKVIHLPAPFLYLSLIIFSVHIFTQSLWARKLLEIKTSGIDDKIIRKLYEYFLLNDPVNKYDVNMIGFYVTLCVFGLALLIFFTVFIQYKVTISFNKPLLYLLRGYFEIVVPVFLLPSIGYAGQFLAGVLRKELAFIKIILSVIGLLIALILFLFYYFHFSVLANSPYFSRGPLSTVRGSYYTNFIFLSFLSQFFSYVLELFPKWAAVIGCLLECSVFIYFAIRGADQPYFNFMMNSYFSALFTTLAVVNFIQAIQGIYYLHDSIPLIALPIVMIPSFIIYTIIYRKTKSQIKKHINEIPEDQRDSIPIISEEFDKIGLDYKMNLYVKYLIVSLEMANEIFLDNAIFKYGIDKYHEPELHRILLIYAAQIPSFNRILSFTYSAFFRSAKLNFMNRFLIYTILRIVTMRQSSSSQQFSQRVIEVRQLTKRCRDLIRGFFLQTPSNASTYYTFYKEAQTTEYRWTELINHYPNSSKVYDEYGDFLIEIMTDFRNATVQKHKTTLLEDGHRLHKDFAFINFIHWYQHYLKRGIVNLHGKVMEQKNKNASSNSTQTSKSGFTGNSTLTSLSQLMEIAPEEEEFYAKALFSSPKLRLAYQRSIEERQSSCAKPMKICIFLIMALSIAVMIACDTIVSQFFSQRASSLAKVKYINYARFYSSISRYASIIYFATQNGYYTINDYVKSKGAKDKNMSPYINFTGDFRAQALYYNFMSLDYYNSFISEIVNYAMAGHDVYNVAAPFLKQSYAAYYCTSNATLLNKTKDTNIHALFSYRAIAANLIYITDANQWNTSKLLCNSLSNAPSVAKGLDVFNENELNTENEDTLDNSHKIVIYEIAFPLSLLFINILLFVCPTIGYYVTLKKTLEILQSIQQKVKEDSTINIGKSNTDDNSAVSPPESQIFVYIFIFGILLIIIVPIFALVTFNEAKSANKKFESLIGWMNLGGARGPLLAEGLEHLTIAALSKTNAFSYIDSQYELDLTEKIIAKVMNFHEVVSEGSDITKPCIGFDSVLDDLQYENICTTSQEATELHERYRCTALSQLFGFVKSIIDDTVVRFPSLTGLDETIFTEIFHLENTHMFKKLFDVTERIDYLGQHNKDRFEILSLIICVIGCILAVVVFMIHMYMALQLDHMYKTAMSIFRRIPPLLITQNHMLMDFLLNRIKKGSSESMTFSQNIIFSSSNGVLLVNKAGVVEMVNDSVNDILGYVPDQILGQQAVILFTEKDRPKVQQQMDLMQAGEAKEVFDDHFECIADDSAIIQCHVTILALSSKGEEINTYVFFISDESQILKKQEQAELAKKKSEELLFQILPRDIVFKLNQGEKDITFTVPSATIMFIDIVRFSDYAANLTPQQIMGNLSLIFDTFDRHLTDYPLITKIKLIGDVYMCAAGLFTPDGQPQEHAQQMLHFAIDCLQEIENINVTLESMLAVRIGVNTGGPLIGGILGTDKPVFDIIGDPINVASRLQSTDIPGKVQIPQSVFDLVHNLDFNIEKRGEVYLKGKGNVTTYLVSPVNIFNMASNNITSSMLILSMKQ
ncbi:Adenylate and Guanylate cyclase catalytic domain containing protein [Trichomonas vaginalis G3]|uniref:Adenylate and Guanylate cyclase catalytic domain containing protein n=1 Tax=Trichomonas vaginalis (strain ATCC PRA-98 / G3) TaxID=412133 RepID=A2FLP2_TRIV3|nr:guanylate cyclase protein [Trichomonas vaginalis G3]EAX94177.1 Adenylate and Guanylate cyclase catalytic domain containing protein [Trichomonas vaginalis G3]KAI5540677.1 guanylate cyclase protein [Trichomonas vaginalis G3]|eukprot:XP_001307107.1 Adenylate and Guanylate cyclase catalytic domain containing protein [Trichomonas vaginalis G3]